MRQPIPFDGLSDRLPRHKMGMKQLRVALMTDKAKEPEDKILRQPDVKPLASSDAQAIATPSALNKQAAETDRTNRSLQFQDDEIYQKVLHIGIPNDAISKAQVAALERIGAEVMQYNATKPFDKAPIQIEVTILK